MQAPAGRSLELFFIDGKPDGMQTAEVFNWTGHVLMAPRTRIVAALNRPEAGYTGVYILLGEKDGGHVAYIGEAEDIASRIRNHDQRKDWWTKAVLVTTAANGLNKAHVKYLEARLVEIARAVGRTVLENGNTPARPGLSEAAQSNMEVFLDYLLMVLPALRIDIFTDHTKPSDARAQEEAAAKGAAFELVNTKQALKARAILLDGEFIVQKGSDARAVWAHDGTRDTGYARLREELAGKGVIVPNGANHVFMKNYAFPSASSAGSVVNGYQTNGYRAWRVPGTRTTYQEWEAGQLGAEGTEP